MSALAGVVVTALLSVLSRLASEAFFEAVLTRVIIWCGEKLAPMTTNSLDDEIVEEIKRRLIEDKAGA